MAGGRADLLAECAGIALGTSEGTLEGFRHHRVEVAELCIAAGADETLIGPWIEVGRRRAADVAGWP